jgi:hypothetical protein
MSLLNHYREAHARETFEEIRIKLEERLLESSIRIEEWKHHFLIEAQERGTEKQSLLDRIAQLSANNANIQR